MSSKRLCTNNFPVYENFTGEGIRRLSAIPGEPASRSRWISHRRRSAAREHRGARPVCAGVLVIGPSRRFVVDGLLAAEKAATLGRVPKTLHDFYRFRFELVPTAHPAFDRRARCGFHTPGQRPAEALKDVEGPCREASGW